jgi:hypothetical protein
MHCQTRHSGLVTEYRAAGPGRRRVHRDHRHAVPPFDEVHPQRLDRRRLPDSGHTGDPHVVAAARLGHQLQQQCLRPIPVIGTGRLDQGDGTRQRRAVAAAHGLGEVLHAVGHLAEIT